MSRLSIKRLTPASRGLIFLLAAVFVLYLPSLRNGFVWDDVGNFKEKHLIAESFDGMLGFLASGDPHTGPKFYRPVQVASFSLDHLLWGLDPAGFRLTNVLLHILVTVFFYRLSLRVLGGEAPALLAAALFAFHPLQAETVFFLSGGKRRKSGSQGRFSRLSAWRSSIS